MARVQVPAGSWAWPLEVQPRLSGWPHLTTCVPPPPPGCGSHRCHAQCSQAGKLLRQAKGWWPARPLRLRGHAVQSPGRARRGRAAGLRPCPAGGPRAPGFHRASPGAHASVSFDPGLCVFSARAARSGPGAASAAHGAAGRLRPGGLHLPGRCLPSRRRRGGARPAPARPPGLGGHTGGAVVRCQAVLRHRPGSGRGSPAPPGGGPLPRPVAAHGRI